MVVSLMGVTLRGVAPAVVFFCFPFLSTNVQLSLISVVARLELAVEFSSVGEDVLCVVGEKACTLDGPAVWLSWMVSSSSEPFLDLFGVGLFNSKGAGLFRGVPGSFGRSIVLMLGTPPLVVSSFRGSQAGSGATVWNGIGSTCTGSFSAGFRLVLSTVAIGEDVTFCSAVANSSLVMVGVSVGCSIVCGTRAGTFVDVPVGELRLADVPAGKFVGSCSSTADCTISADSVGSTSAEAGVESVLWVVPVGELGLADVPAGWVWRFALTFGVSMASDWILGCGIAGKSSFVSRGTGSKDSVRPADVRLRWLKGS